MSLIRTYDDRYEPSISWLFVILAAIVYLAQSLNLEYSFVSGLLIPDVYMHTLAIYDYIGDTGYRFWEQAHVYWGMTLLYGAAVYYFPETIVFINVLLLVAIYSISNILVRDITGSKNNLVSLLVVLNPYFLLACSGVNKEIPLALLTLGFAVFYLRNKMMLSLVMVALMYLFRDGYAAVILCFIFFDKLWKLDKRLGVAMMFFAGILVARLYPILMDYVSVFERNASSAFNSFSETGTKDAFVLDRIPELSYVYRLAANIVSLSLRPRFFDENNGLYLLGIAYHIIGVQILIAYVVVAITLISRKYKSIDSPTRTLVLLIASIVIMQSVSLYVQPRYLFVMLPLMVIMMYSLRMRYRYINSVNIVMFHYLFFLLNVALFVLGLHPVVEADAFVSMRSLL